MSSKLSPKPAASRKAGRLLIQFTDAFGRKLPIIKGASPRYLKRAHQSGRCRSHCSWCITESEHYLAAANS